MTKTAPVDVLTKYLDASPIMPDDSLERHRWLLGLIQLALDVGADDALRTPEKAPVSLGQAAYRAYVGHMNGPAWEEQTSHYRRTWEYAAGKAKTARELFEGVCGPSADPETFTVAKAAWVRAIAAVHVYRKKGA